MSVALVCLATTPQLGPATTGGNAARAESASFIVVSRSPQHDARQMATMCEQWRTRLVRYWCGQTDGEPGCECCGRGDWSPKCELVIHAGRAGYLASVGAGAGSTYGSSLIQFGDGKQVARRQIDIRGDSERGQAALPHEMTHVILADLLDGSQPPRWADEGMATLADSSQKQRLHERDLAHGLASGRAFRLAELMAIDAYPHPSRVPAFYGQSVSLTAFLAARDAPPKFVEFLRQSQAQGYDRALREVYAIDGVSHLERLWHEQRPKVPGALSLVIGEGPIVATTNGQ